MGYITLLLSDKHQSQTPKLLLRDPPPKETAVLSPHQEFSLTLYGAKRRRVGHEAASRLKVGGSPEQRRLLMHY